MSNPVYAVIPAGRRKFYFTLDYTNARDIPITDTQSGLWHGPFESSRGARIILDMMRRDN